jgi:hypothetical protein
MGRQFASFAVVATLVVLFTQPAPATTQPAITGEIVETYCWARMRVNGPAHAACGIECAKRGIPIAIVDGKTRKAYVLLPGRDKRSVPPELVAAMGHTVTIHGEILSRGGTNFLTVQSFKRASR